MEFSSAEIQTLTTLRMISQLQSENKLLTTSKQVSIDKNSGMWQGVCRYFKNENRVDNLARVKQTFAEAFDMLRKQRSRVTCEHISTAIEEALNGLKSLQVTYHADLHFCSQVDVLITTIASRIKSLRDSQFVIESWVPFEW